MAASLTKEENQKHTLAIILAAGEDKSWKVRLCFAKRFAEFAEAFGEELTNTKLIEGFTNLISDTEQEVKNSAITSLTSCLPHISVDKIV